MSISPLLRTYHNWLKWHKAGRSGSFLNPLSKEVELDITTRCSSSLSCGKTCTYRHSKGLDHTLDVGLGLRIIEQTFNLGFRDIVFSGGGEPLEPESQDTFFTLLKAARLRSFRTMLITNGMFLSPDTFYKVFPYLNLLRISISGSSHLQAVRDNIDSSIASRDEFYPGLMVGASRLIMPDTPEEELTKDVDDLSRLNIDHIRFKRTHLKWAKEGSFASNIKAYEEKAGFISKLNQRYPAAESLDARGLPNSEIFRYPICYFSDFFPFTIGADGKAYACCETKYREEFVRGDFREQTAEEILENIARRPQEVKEEHCFCGCIGDSTNVDLHRFITE